MWPRLVVTIHPSGITDGEYVARIRKGWWGGPGKGATSYILGELYVDTHAELEEDRVRQVLRVLADADWVR